MMVIFVESSEKTTFYDVVFLKRYPLLFLLGYMVCLFEFYCLFRDSNDTNFTRVALTGYKNRGPIH